MTDEKGEKIPWDLRKQLATSSAQPVQDFPKCLGVLVSLYHVMLW